MELPRSRTTRPHPGVIAYSVTNIAQSQSRELQELAAGSRLQPTIIPINGSPQLTGIRIGGLSSDAHVSHAGGIVARGVSGPSRPAFLNISDAREAGASESTRLWIRSEVSPFEAPFIERSRCVSMSVPISSLTVDLTPFDLTTSSSIAAPPIAVRTLRSVAELVTSDVSEWLANSPEAIDRYLVGVVGLIVAAIFDERGESFFEHDRAWLRTRAHSLIDTQFFDPSLAPATIAAKLGVSLRSLHRAFEGEPGVAETLRSRRIAHAAGLLAGNHSRQLPITDIARRSGFASIATFERSFVAAHETSPHRFRVKARSS